MTNEELQRFVEEVSIRDFGRAFNHRATFNKRLQSTGGRYHLNDHHLDFNPKMLTLGDSIFLGIIRHELCHYHLHLENKGYRHQDSDFKKLLKETNGLRYVPKLKTNTFWKAYQCTGCKQFIYRKRHINTEIRKNLYVGNVMGN